MNKLSLLIILICFAWVPLIAQEDSADFHHFTTADGLPSNNIYSVIKDRLGYIWMATDNGVVKYNGSSFRIFNTNDGLSSNDVWRVYEDKSGRIWLLTNSYYIGYISGDTYHPVHLQNGSNFIYPKQISDNGQCVLLWYMTKGLFNIAVIKDDAVVVSNIMSLSAAYDVCFVIVASDFRVFLFSRNGNIYRFDFLGNGRVISNTCGGNLRKLVSLSDIILSFKGRFYLYTPGTSRFEMFDPALCKNTLVELDRADPSDKIVVASPFYDRITMLTGKYLYTIKGAKPQEISRTPLPTFLRSKTSWIYNETSGSQWYCTYTEGIWLKNRNTLLSAQPLVASGLSKSQIVGSSGDTIFWWDKNRSRLILTANATVVKEINFPGLGYLKWAGNLGNHTLGLCFLKSIYSYDMVSGKLRSVFFDEPRPVITYGLALYSKKRGFEIMNDSVKYGYFRNSERLIAISDSAMLHFAFGIVGLFRMGKDSIFLSQILKEKPLGLLRDSATNSVILFSRHNVFLFDDRWRGHKIESEVLELAGIRDICNIVQTAGNDFFIHCDNGIFFFNNRDKKLEALRYNFHLAGSFSMIWRNYFIVVGNFGLAYAEITPDKTIRPFRVLPNFKSRSYSILQNCAIDSSGNLFITADKITRLVPFGSILKDANAFGVDKDTMVQFNLTAPFPKRLFNNDTVRVDQSTANIAIDNINYFSGASPQYHYKTLSGKWKKSPSGEIFLENIHPGEYYKIELYLQDDFWISDLTTIYLYQPYRWYQTFVWRTIFLSVGAFVFFLSLLLVFVLTRRYVAKSNDKKRLQTELELRAVHAQINPHFIFNTLSTALYYISKQQSNEAYDHVSRFSKLLRGYLKSSRERLIVLADEISMLEQYIKLQKAGFQRPFDHEVHLDQALAAHEIMIPSLLLQPIVENAINHGLFHKPEKGKLILSFIKGKDDTELICVIDDNGVGRAQSKIIQRNLKLKKESYGTALTDDLIDVIQKYEHMNIGIVYIDKEFPATGTIVRLTIGNVKKVEKLEARH
jgi:two-component sensor histidine kinase